MQNFEVVSMALRISQTLTSSQVLKKGGSGVALNDLYLQLFV